MWSPHFLKARVYGSFVQTNISPQFNKYIIEQLLLTLAQCCDKCTTPWHFDMTILTFMPLCDPEMELLSTWLKKCITNK